MLGSQGTKTDAVIAVNMSSGSADGSGGARPEDLGGLGVAADGGADSHAGGGDASMAENIRPAAAF